MAQSGVYFGEMLQKSTVFPLLNLSVEPNATIMQSSELAIRIRDIRDDERARWQDNDNIQFVLGELAGLLPIATTAIEIAGTYPGDVMKHETANPDLYSLLGLLDVFVEHPPWTPFAEISPATTDTGFDIEYIGEQKPPPIEFNVRPTVRMHDTETVSRYWNAITGPTERNRSLRRALSRFVRARSANWGEDAITHAIIGIESLFGKNNDSGKSSRIIRRATAFLTDPGRVPTKVETASLKQWIADIYEPRHDIFHGREVRTHSLSLLAKRGIEILREIILIALEEGFARLDNIDAVAGEYDNEERAQARAQKHARRQPTERSMSGTTKPIGVAGGHVYPEQDTVKGEDWRLYAVTAVSQDGGGYKIGDVIKRRRDLALPDGSAIQVGAFNPHALLLSFSARLDAKTKSLLDDIERIKDGPHRRFDKVVFDGIEQRIASAIFGITAVEAFANEVISYAYAQGFQYEQKRKRKLIEVLNYQSALEDLRLEEKIGYLLPQVFKTASPRGTLPWQHFRRLIRLRNRIIHLKPQDSGSSADSSLWEDLLSPHDGDFGKQSHALIGYFVKNMNQSGLKLNTRWFYKFPY
jgi:hypothetical protein